MCGPCGVQKSLATLLVENGQEHLFASWAAPGTDDAKKHAFFAQVKRLHESYPAPGGLAAYISEWPDTRLTPSTEWDTALHAFLIRSG